MQPTSLRIYAQSAIGNTHLSKQLPNQDSVRFWCAPDSHHFCVAISDGHGSSSHPHSDVGSRIAVTVANNIYESTYLDGIKSLEPKIFFETILQRWSSECLDCHKLSHPTSESSTSSILKLYGATLCVIYVCGDTIIVASIGDSTVYFRNHTGLVSGFLIHEDSPGEATFSLCQSNALSHLETKNICYSPGIVVASTDGVIKSLKSSTDYALISDYYLSLALASDTDESKVNADLTVQLQDFSTNGSGDDCTLALVLIPPSPSSTLSTVDVLSDVTQQPVPLSRIKSDSRRDKKKLLQPLVIVAPVMLITLLLTFLLSLLTYKPFKNHFLYLIRSSLCIKGPSQTTLPQPLLLLKHR